jgi:hypothetical protein
MKSNNELSEIQKELKSQEIDKVNVNQNPIINESANRSLDILSDLHKISVVTENEIAKITQSKQFVFESYIDVPSHRTFVQKMIGVLSDDKFPTHDSKFWQCKKEAEVQYQELMRAFHSYQYGMVDMKEIIYKKSKAIESLSSPNFSGDKTLVEFDIERLDIKFQEYAIRIKQFEKEIKYRISEIFDWFRISKELEPNMEHSSRDYAEHEVKTIFKKLEKAIENSKEVGNDKALENFEGQMATLKRILSEKAKEALKEDQ